MTDRNITPAEVPAKVRAFIEENFLFSENPIGDGDSLLQLGLIDSTGVLELVAFIEKDFGVVMRDEEIAPENLDSIASIARFVLEKQPAGEPA